MFNKFCRRCNLSYSDEEIYINHKNDCLKKLAQKLVRESLIELFRPEAVELEREKIAKEVREYLANEFDFL